MLQYHSKTGQVKKPWEKKFLGKHGYRGLRITEGFDFRREKRLLMKKNKKFFTDGSLNGVRLKKVIKENLKNKEGGLQWQKNLFERMN